MGSVRSSRLYRNITKGKQRVYIAISVGLIAHLGGIEMLRRETKRLQSHLGETKIPIGETDLPRIERIGGAEFDFWFRSYVDVRKLLRDLEHITKHFEQEPH